MGTKSSGIGVAERGGGGINTLALSSCKFTAFCVLGMVDRRTVICFGSCGIVIGGFEMTDACVGGDCNESAGSGFVECICKCSVYNDSMENDFAHTPHCHFGWLVFGATVGVGATGFRLWYLICILRLDSNENPLSQTGHTCIRAFGEGSVFARTTFTLAGAGAATGFAIRLG